MQLSSNFYELQCYISNFIYNNQFLANVEMSQSLLFLMNMSTSTNLSKTLFHVDIHYWFTIPILHSGTLILYQY